MIDFSILFPKDLYHSYVIEGHPEEVGDVLRSFLEDNDYVNKQSQDMLFNLYDSFAVIDSQRVKEWYQNKTTDGKKKICIIGAKFINREAEQTLLKIIEEPTPNTHFFIIVPDSSLLGGTILSRVHLVNTKSDNKEDEEYVKEFLKLNPATRIEKIADLVKDFKDNESSGGLRFKAINIVNGIERIFYKKWKEDLNNENYKFILNELKNCRDFLSTPGASVKMILEHIALVV